jgi:UDP-2-acetamido-2,6-beta-L-arabino-hexul-4-ose reductase
MKVLVTGSKGFIGKNLCLTLRNRGHEVLEFDLPSTDDDLRKMIAEADFIVHLAGVNRAADVKLFKEVNFGLTQKIVDMISECRSSAPLLLGSSTQAALDNPYGESKALAEAVVNNFGFQGHSVYVYRLYNVFGKWCKPNYNSVVATFCYNIAHNLPIEINEKAPSFEFVYVDDVVTDFVNVIENRPQSDSRIHYVEPCYDAKPIEIAQIIKSFHSSRDNLMIPFTNDFEKKLYATYLSYLPDNGFAYPLTSHSDPRGSFAEFLKGTSFGQFSVNVIKPGAVKGNHYHMSKNEKYLVVSGSCEIRERLVDGDKIASYVCTDKNLMVVDIIPGWVHSIKNVGSKDAVVLMWASDVYDPNNADTYLMPVEKE